ncbi:MAG: PilX N-terminal domain-containing pilus assembly protein [Vicinamibacterales bacterium]
MTMHNRRSSIKSEDGFALVLVLLVLLVVTGLSAAMVTSGRTEVLISVNQERAAQARAAAEAGLNHALAVSIVYVQNWQANGFANASAAMTSLLRGPDGDAATVADNGSLAALANGIPMPPARIVLDAAAGTSYEAWAIDEDSPLRGLSADDHVRIAETGDATLDTNGRVTIRAIGYASGGTTATLEATVGPIILPAIVTNDNLTISGNPMIGGANGSVHSNANLTISGNPTITENATASGNYTTTGSPNIGGQSGGGRPNLTIPPVNAADHRPLADFILHGDGRMTTQDETNVICDASVTNDACKDLGYGWVYSPSGGAMGLPQWNITSNSAPNANATFYVEGDARISGSPGSAATPLAISIIAEGDIEISGNPNLRPDLPELMLVTNRDLKISGLLEQPIAFEGQMLVREQLHISGNPTLAGQILVENAANVSNLVLSNTISGNPTIIYNGIVGTNTFVVVGWREIR